MSSTFPTSEAGVQIANYLAEASAAATPTIADAVELTYETIREALKKLEDSGAVDRVTQSPGHATVWRLADGVSAQDIVVKPRNGRLPDGIQDTIIELREDDSTGLTVRDEPAGTQRSWGV